MIKEKKRCVQSVSLSKRKLMRVATRGKQDTAGDFCASDTCVRLFSSLCSGFSDEVSSDAEVVENGGWGKNKKNNDSRNGADSDNRINNRSWLAETDSERAAAEQRLISFLPNKREKRICTATYSSL